MKNSKKPSLRSLKKQQRDLNLALSKVNREIWTLKSGVSAENLKNSVGRCYKINTLYGMKFILVREAHEDRVSGLVYRPNLNILGRLPEADMNTTIFNKEAASIKPENEISLNTFMVALAEGVQQFKKISGKVFLSKIVKEAVNLKK